MILKAAPDVVSRSLGSFGVLVNLKTNHIFQLNETGARIWQLIVEGTSVRDIILTLGREFDVDITTATDQTMTLIEELFEQGLIER